MKTYKIKKESDLDKYKDEYGYHIIGNLVVDCSFEVDERLLVDGYLSIKAGEYIEAGESYGISAGLSINAKGKIKLGLKIFAGICTWREIEDKEKAITCSKLEGGSVEYGIVKETGEKKRQSKG